MCFFVGNLFVIHFRFSQKNRYSANATVLRQEESRLKELVTKSKDLEEAGMRE